MKLIRTGAILKVVGVLLMIVGFVQGLCIPVSFYFETGHASDFISSVLLNSLAGGLLLFWSGRLDQTVKKREGYLIVFLAWIALWVSSALPYVLSGVFESFTDIFFEAMSGLSTTGATILEDIEAVPKDILLWRSFTQWLGAMGFIVLTVALLPIIGIGGIELFVAEAPGPTSEKLHPRIKDTAKALWRIYLGMTLLLFPLLYYGGMSGYDALNHALTTMATGGFSTKNESAAFFSPQLQYIMVVFMFLSGVNFSLHYLALRGRFRQVFQSDELKVYLGLVVVMSIIVFALVSQQGTYSVAGSFRIALFQVVSTITTSGFVVADYTAWSPLLMVIFFVLLFSGASAGSTSGGIKLIRHTVMIKNSILEFKRLLHPRAMIRLKINKKIVPPRVMTHVMVFYILYIGTFMFGTLLVILTGVEIGTSMGAVATSISNVGPGVGEVGPVHTFAGLNSTAKWILAWIMLIGRLEIFTVFIILTPYFWRHN